MAGPARVRFAPSPTGYLHLGGLRTALYSWLLARQTGGQFILRIEDTDRSRLVDESLQQIKDSLTWLGLDWDEGPDQGGPHAPYLQSERLGLYAEQAEELIRADRAYRCWCDEARLEKLRAEAKAAGSAFKYDRHCLLQPGDASQPHVIRFKMPDAHQASWHDEIRGEMAYETGLFDDFVLVKADGFATYNFANVVDDHLMQISHVIRGEEFIASTPRHVEVYRALGWEPPKFAHLPQVLGPDKAKLSKRHGAKSALELRDEGYLPAAVMNFLALLGWNPGEGSTKEVYTRAELVEAFSLDRVQKSPAIFDLERLGWLNGIYIRVHTSPEQLYALSQPFWPAGAAAASETKKSQILELLKDKLKTLGQLAAESEYFFAEPIYSLEILAKLKAERPLLEAALAELEICDFSTPCLTNHMNKLMAKFERPAGKIYQPIRMAVTGRQASPGIFETLQALGKETVLQRLGDVIALLD